ncbi:MAG: SufS family cysteine desulfurase [Clostridiales bacterium]|nr:SufS family cysteine desulfurase [Clostridiales bacterium]
MSIDVNAIRKEFPLINDEVAYLDNAATTQKPECVIKAISDYYRTGNANPMRGLYKLSVAATDTYENARSKVASFINAQDPSDIVFTRNATESINLVAETYAMANLGEGDSILISIAEHHSNLLPWQRVAAAKGCKLKYIDTDESGKITVEAFKAAVTADVKFVAINQISNVLGTLNPVREFSKITHDNGAKILVDASQSVPHIKVDVTEIDCDFLVFSGHKIYAPMGIGALYGKKELLEAMPPFLRGGEMIDYVTRDSATFTEVPHKFEAGTVNVEGAAGLTAALDYVSAIGIDEIAKREEYLTKIAFEKLSNVPHVKILGSSDYVDHHGILTFVIEGVHPHDIAYIMDADDVCVRAGHHCAQPLMKHLGVMSTTRASISFYNTEDEIDRFVRSVAGIRSKMGYAE